MFLTGQVHNPFTELHPGDLALFAHAALMSMYYVIFFALAKIGAVQSSINAYVIPITAATWGIFIFNETLGVSFLVAASLVLLGLFTLNKSWQT